VDGIDFLRERKHLLYLSHSDSETRSIGSQLAKLLPKNTIVCFFGDLGAGKTTFIKGLASALTECPIEEISSPTYTYLNIYSGVIPVYHFDLYRLKGQEEFLHMGFDDFFDADGICCIEWAERIPELIPDGAWKVTLTHMNSEQRQIELFIGKAHEP
jgi:tRNA threonylcarbamoyladenosine biosynthesis protein TsaE